jgi:endogenous inhibitor of DNA gyrase (YacG/DUF329 family)
VSTVRGYNPVMPEFTCAICRIVVSYAEALPRHYPFCGQRCARVDLGRWFREQYAIERDLSPEEAAGQSSAASHSSAAGHSSESPDNPGRD